MNQLVLTLELPEEVYERVRRTAKGMKQPVEQAVATIVRAATPSLDKVPPQYRVELEALEDLGDEELWQVTDARLNAGKQRRLEALLDKNDHGEMAESGRQALAKLRSEADRLMLRRAYAFLLLKYRGHRFPNPAEGRQ